MPINSSPIPHGLIELKLRRFSQSSICGSMLIPVFENVYVSLLSPATPQWDKPCNFLTLNMIERELRKKPLDDHSLIRLFFLFDSSLFFCEIDKPAIMVSMGL